MKIRKGKAVFLFALTLLVASCVFIQVGVEQPPDVAYIDPPEIHTGVCENFTVTVIANVSSDVISFEFILHFNLTQMSGVDVVAVTPWELVHIEIMPDYVWVGSGILDSPIGPGSISLVEITFHCDALGSSNLWFQHVTVEPLGPLPWQGATVHQWCFKASYGDYAPSGMPDFDQRQDNWNNSVGTWTWCGPLAAANSLWWFDSKFEPNPLVPPRISDGFPLVSAWTGLFDDHHPDNVQPFVNDLAWFMDTDGRRTGLAHNGTKVHDMEAGIAQYLSSTHPLHPVGLNPHGDANGDGKVDVDDQIIVENAMGSVPGDPSWDLAADLNGDNTVDANDLAAVLNHLGEVWGRFYEKTVPKPTYSYVVEQVEKSEDVVILLGFWQDQGGVWVRLGGHYVTVSGVNSANLTMAFSDPIKDDAELGFPGRVIPPPPHPHSSTPPFPLHNNASYVSHDFYDFDPLPTSPGGDWGPEGYNRSIDIIEDFFGQNIPKEFEGEEFEGSYNPLYPLLVYVEYTVVVSPTPDVAITNVTPQKTVVAQNSTMSINVTVANGGLSDETFNVTAYYQSIALSEGFESGTFADWDFYYSTNQEQNGTIYYYETPVAEWNSTIVTGASALSGSCSARLFADFWQHTYVVGPWRVDAAVNRTINRGWASVLRATLKFNDIQGSGGTGHSYFGIDVFNALNTAKRVFYGFSTTGDYGDIKYSVSSGDSVDFERNIATDYFNKYGENLPYRIMIRFLSSADYAEASAQRRTTDVLIDDISIVGVNTSIDTKEVTLARGNSTVINFTWNTTSFPYGNYTISADVDILPSEADTADNVLVDGSVFVTILGDVDGDGDVDGFDLTRMCGVYGSTRGDSEWDEPCDLNGDGIIDGFDLTPACGNYGKTI